MLFLNKQNRCQAGYTLVELMVAVALTGIVTIAIYKSYISVSVGYDVQDQVVEVQQNARVAMDRMVRDIRMAGCDPELNDVPGFANIENSNIHFTMDITGGVGGASDGDVDDFGEDVTYSLVGENLTKVDTTGGSAQVVIGNVSALRFIYYDTNGAITSALANVRAVQIALLVRATNEDYAFTDTRQYNIEDLSDNVVPIYTAPGDNFRRQLLTAVVRCRNMSMAD